MKKLLALCFVALLATACTTTMGVKMDETKTSFIQKGKTTKADVVAQLGKPTSTERDSSGREILVWEYELWQQKVMYELKESSRLAVIIDQRGRVFDYTLSKGGAASK